MYHPYFRGKQNELITVRETAVLMAANAFTPIIEPVKESLGGLHRALTAVRDAGGSAIAIVNPFHGALSEDSDGIGSLLRDEFAVPNISAGVLLHKDTTIDDVLEYAIDHDGKHDLTFIHAGFADAKGLVDVLDEMAEKSRHVFLEPFCGKLYRKHFIGDRRVLLRDGFQRRRNRDHPDVEFFSDLHITYPEEGMNGFGDFLIVGDDYAESGGPAYAVAIHLTFIDPEKDDAMFIYHFKSKRMDTPTDPAGKFGEALAAMIEKLDSGTSKVLETEAVKEFRALHKEGHFPGLGYVKKLSMRHHIETLADYLGEA